MADQLVEVVPVEEVVDGLLHPPRLAVERDQPEQLPQAVGPSGSQARITGCRGQPGR